MTDEEWQRFVWEQSRRVERENRERGLPKLTFKDGQLVWTQPTKGAKVADMKPVED